MVIHRNFSLSEMVDYRLNVLGKINNKMYAKKIRDGKDQVVGWKILSL